MPSRVWDGHIVTTGSSTSIQKQKALLVGDCSHLKRYSNKVRLAGIELGPRKRSGQPQPKVIDVSKIEIVFFSLYVKVQTVGYDVKNWEKKDAYPGSACDHKASDELQVNAARQQPGIGVIFSWPEESLSLQR